MRLRPAGFDAAVAMLVGRTAGPDDERFSQRDVGRSALGDLGLPVVLDVDCGHLPPHLALVNGALAQVVMDGEQQTVTQTLA